MSELSRTVLAFLAHPDDAEFLCAGTLIRLADAGWSVHIGTATAGDCGSVTEDSWTIAAVRTGEARRAAALIGATYHCLGEPDALVVYDKPTLRKTIEMFRAVGPSLVFTHPAKDYMMDHEMVHPLARAAAFICAAPNISAAPLPPGARIPHLYYCDPVTGCDPSGQPVEPTTWIDITAQMERKEQMLACHASQRQWLQAHHGMDEYMETMRRLGRMRGEGCHCRFAEAFVQHRGHAFPQDDLLTELFGA